MHTLKETNFATQLQIRGRESKLINYTDKSISILWIIVLWNFVFSHDEFDIYYKLFGKLPTNGRLSKSI